MSKSLKSLITSFQPAAFFLLLSLLLLLLPHIFRLPIPLTLLILGIIFWRALFELGMVSLPGKILRFILLLLSLAMLVQHYSTFIGREAGSALLLFLISLKLMELKTYRDQLVVLFLAYFLVVLTFLFSQTIYTSIYLFSVLVCLILTQILIHHPLAKDKSWLTVTTHLKLVFKLIAHAAPLTLLLFLLFPRVSGPLWGLPEDAFSGQTGLSDTMQPGAISELSNNDAVAFRVKFKNAIPDNRDLYWRGPVLWRFNGERWSAPKHENRPQITHSLNTTDTSTSLSYEITLQPHNKRWLFTLDTPIDYPTSSNLSLERLVTSRLIVQKLIRYQATSVIQPLLDKDYNWKLYDRYLKVPNFTAPRSRALIASLKKTNPTDQAFVEAVLDYFRTKPFYYSRTPPLLFEQPIDEFLFSTRKGFCEHYASTFTVMMRLAGIPARVVTGYQGGTLNPLSDYMIVRQSDAHAWTEVWLEKRGWLRIDPTAVIPPHRIENPIDIIQRQPGTSAAIKLLDRPWVFHAISQVKFAFDAINNRWNQWIVGYNQKKQASLFQAFGIPEISWDGLTVILGISTILTLMLVSFTVFRTKKTAEQPLLKTYQLFCKRLEKIGIRKLPHETPLVYANKIINIRSDLKSEVNSIIGLYQRLRYTRHYSKTLYQRLVSKVKNFHPKS